jgi:protein TonB
MFETVVPERVSPRSRKLFYEMLPLSLTIHACAAAVLVVSASWRVDFPVNSPRMYEVFALAEVPPPPPPPPPPPVARAQPVPVRTVVRMPDVAPNVIPDEIPVVLPEPPAPEVAEAAPIPGAQPGGVEGGVAGGEVGGDVGGTIASVAPPAPSPRVIEVARDAPLPMGAIDQEYPVYPEFYITRGIQDSLVVRYLIGKDGLIKEVSVIRPPEHADFAREALSKIRHWRFHPYRDEHGEPKEVSHELTVEFKIARRRR